MSILIKGMEMPKSCDICPFAKTNDDLSVEDYRSMYCDFPGIGEYVTDYEAARHPDCPLVEVPPHNDLIDVNALKIAIMGIEEGSKLSMLKHTLDCINNAPVVIPKDKEET